MKNVKEDALKGVLLNKNTVFFGINGAGKSTVCEVLRSGSTFKDSDPTSSDEANIFSFDEKWKKDNIGDFIEGGSAKGVTTVRLSKNAGEIEEKIRQAESDLERNKKATARKLKEKEQLLEKQKEITSAVFKGERKRLENRCAQLSGKSFNRTRIAKLLEKGGATVLSPSEIDQRIEIANSPHPGGLQPLPTYPARWSISEDLWNEICRTDPPPEEFDIDINEWVRTGLSLHQVNDKCQFCDGLFTESRFNALVNAIRQIEKKTSSSIKEAYNDCCFALSELDRFGVQLDSTSFSDTTYGADLEPIKNRVLLLTGPVMEELRKTKSILNEKIENPWTPVTRDRPRIDYGPLNAAFEQLRTKYSEALTEMENHTRNQEKAIEDLKKHCCATDGAEWRSNSDNLEEAIEALNQASASEHLAQQRLDELKHSISTTSDTADFIDKYLAIILGENILRVTEGKSGEGYRIERFGKPADGMSEGERKLVSLLYFCAEFRTEARKEALKNALVMFDDLGSELDETRLLAVDRFITNQFQKRSGVKLVYFTHSHTHLKILQERLRKKVKEQKKRDKIMPATAVFYEVYKDHLNDNQQSTAVRLWDVKAVELVNDYWLSFYMVIQAFKNIQNNEPPPFSAGNYCRKVLEGFTEFKAPTSEQFGSRIDHILNSADIPLSPSLSKIVNIFSHSGLDRKSAFWSRSEIESAIIQTLHFMLRVDRCHFETLLKAIEKDDYNSILTSLRTRLQIDR
ncbi:AAA family ATPase [Corynebacterium meridianum]|uniref:AAA family ATPase n=1 Tax=Corynebacterium meridianum TaxID=2765363 RepID=A0A934I3Q4_9CORY|nr:AAA family ATPase [Corynebacterium meridianum]MBI8989561.1 AAA family ATPase [Corynebacterium meridianum]